MRISTDYLSDSERLHKVIKSYILNNPKITRKIERQRITKFFDYCIICQRRLDKPSRRNHRFYKNIELFKLRFCCSCFEQFKDMPFDKFPEHIIEDIQRKIKAYKEY